MVSNIDGAIDLTKNPIVCVFEIQNPGRLGNDGFSPISTLSRNAPDCPSKHEICA
jgi:hypothetical protein